MNKLDEYYFWIDKAIKEPNVSNVYHYFNCSRNEVFSLTVIGDNMSCHFRNEWIPPSPDKLAAFDINLKQLRAKSENIISLPRLTLAEKKNFLLQFIELEITLPLKNKFVSEVNSLTEQDKFDFKTNLKEIDRKLYVEFDRKKGYFTTSTAIRLYSVFGITETSTVLW